MIDSRERRPDGDQAADKWKLTADLGRFGRKVYCQNNEDGILQQILSDLNISRGYFVEFGVGPPWGKTFAEAGLEANCRLLREQGWSGLFMDSGEYPPEAAVAREHVSPFNINALLRKHAVPHDFDVLSIDIDGQDFWVWMNLLSAPRIVIIEYNASLPLERSCVVPLLADFAWDTTSWFGASLAALDKLARSRFYTLVYANGVNAFFVRSDLLANHQDFQIERLYVHKTFHPDDRLGRPWVTI
jgi:hypothetical protein